MASRVTQSKSKLLMFCATALFAVATVLPAEAETIQVQVAGLVGTVTDQADMLGLWGIPLELGTTVQGTFEVDRQAGILRFGDGEHGQVPAVGGIVTSGTYRAGTNGNVRIDLFDDCFVGTIGDYQSIPGHGADAYLVTFLPNPDAQPVERISLLLATDGPGPILQSDTFGPIPPPLDSFPHATWTWTVAAADGQATVSGPATSVAVAAPEPSALTLLMGGLASLGLRWPARRCGMAR